jgi:ribosome-associated protein
MDWSQVLKEVQFTAIRSRGPGGQNVNKVSSAARLNWIPYASQAFCEEEKLRLLSKLENQVTKSGELVLRSDEFRDLERNKDRCLEKLRNLLREALHQPKARKKTKPSFSEKLRRREKKQGRSEVKRSRRKVDW